MGRLHLRLAAAVSAVCWLCLLALAFAPVSGRGIPQSPPLPKHRSVMTLLVEHRTQFPEYVNKIAELGGAINVAAPICFNPGGIGPATNLTQGIYCMEDFLVPMRNRSKTVTIHPIIQMANKELLSALKHFGWAVKAFKEVAMTYPDLIDGFLFYPQVRYHGFF